MEISILGCGWLGLPLAKHLIKNGHSAKGSTTSVEKLKTLEAAGIEPFLIELSPKLENPQKVRSFWNSEVLVVNIPPGRKRNDVMAFHAQQICSITEAIENSPIKFVVFVSSTSVYSKFPGAVSEKDTTMGKAGRNSGNALLEAEKMLMENSSFETTVLRFGGLLGYNRNPVKYLAGKKELKRGGAPVNMIHRDDCIAIITQIIEKNITNEIFNAVSDEHTSRKKYYTEAAKELGLEPPIFSEDHEKKHKLVNNDKLKAQLGYVFKR